MIRTLLLLLSLCMATPAAQAAGTSMRALAAEDAPIKAAAPPVPDDWTVVPSPFADVHSAHGDKPTALRLSRHIATAFPRLARDLDLPIGNRVHVVVARDAEVEPLLEVAGADPPAGLQGASLLSALHGSPAKGREVVFTEGLLRMVSATTSSGRLVFSGMGADSPWLAETMRAARLDGPAFEVEGTLSLEEKTRLRDELVAWRAGLVLGGESGAELSEEQIQSLQQGGYWQ